jgi:hypothetical protein
MVEKNLASTVVDSMISSALMTTYDILEVL